MKQILAAIMLLALAPVAQARPIDWQADWIAAARCASKWSLYCVQEWACPPLRDPGLRRAVAFGLNGGR